jgi:peptidoglycan/xylan/chitin deacetylase (PgdA/CDA1 family)
VRPLAYGLVALALAGAVGFAWPERAWLGVSLVLGASFAFGLFGALSLRSGIWCRALSRGAPAGGRVALTYDDGPDPRSTPPLLDLLEERGVRAAFFCVGARVRAHPELALRMAEAGHELGNHSDEHSHWTNFFPGRRLAREVQRCQESVRAATGRVPRFFRPPFGLTNHATGPVARELGLEVIGWQVRGLDLPGSAPERVAQRVLAGLRPGGVVLLHDGDREPELVVGATRALLDGLEERGLRAVPLGELLER